MLAGSDPLYLWGPSGCGKSHLLQAAVALAAEAGRPAQLIAGEDLELLPDAPGLLAIDAVDEAPAEAQIALFNIINRRVVHDQTLLLAGRVAPLALAVREDLRTRIGQGLIFRVQPLGEAELRAILEARAQERGLRLDGEVLDFMLRHGRRDLSSLLAVFEALDAASLEYKRPITLPLLRSLIQTGLSI